MEDTPVSNSQQTHLSIAPPLELLESISDAIFTLDSEWRFTYLNARAELMFKKFRSELIGKNTWQEYPHAVNTRFYNEYHRSAETRDVIIFEEYSKVLQAWLFIRITPFQSGLCILLQDVTERKMAEAERLERSAIIDSAFDAILGKTLDGIITSWNPSAERLYGYSAEEAVGQHISLIVPPERSDELPPIMEEIRQGGKVERPETIRRRKDGSRVYVSVTISPILNAHGEIVGASSIARNITERKMAEASITAREERLNGILLSAMDGIVSVDSEERILLFNAAAERMLGCSAIEALGSPITRFIPARFHKRHSNHIHEFGRTGVTSREMGALTPLVALRADGEEFPIEATISQIDTQGEKTYTVIMRDITERKRLEEQFLQSQKMEGIGRLAGGIAHDFNNLLAAIIGYSELAEMELKGDDKTKEYLANVTKAAERAAALTHQLLAFARKQVSEPKIVDLNELVRDLEKLLRRLIGEDIDFTVKLGDKPVVVRVDPSQLAQVLINLAVNARDAMPDGGALGMEVRMLQIGESEHSHPPDLPTGSYASVRVKDSGAGMSADVLQHLFEPFFTTKEPGKGTGLGLATSYGIVKQAGGDVTCSSEVGVGTTFTIYLPLIDGPAGPSHAIRSLSRMPVGTETLLFVEDEALVRGFAVQVLRSLNYTVIEAEDGRQAMEIINQGGDSGSVDLLITDLIMPHMGGHELAQQLRELRPDLKVLYCSGYTDDHVHRHGVLDNDMTFVQKPYTPSVLAVKVRELLDS